jgi:uncharacterized lipoprotein YajG
MSLNFTASLLINAYFTNFSQATIWRNLAIRKVGYFLNISLANSLNKQVKSNPPEKKMRLFMKKQMKLAFYFCVLAIFLTSCSTKTSLSYNPIIEERPKNHICVTVDSFQDTRSQPQKIGALRNGYGMPIVKITTDDDVPTWMKTALEEELANAGFTVINKEKEDTYYIKGSILRISSGTYLTYSGKISMEMTLNQGSNVLLKKQYTSKENDGRCWILTPFINSRRQASKCSKALSYSLQEIYKQFIADVNQEIYNQQLSTECEQDQIRQLPTAI